MNGVRRSRTAVIDHSTDNTTQSLSADATIISRTATLPPGTYLALGKVKAISFTASGSPGRVYLRAAGAQIGAQIDLRTLPHATHLLFGHFVHAGGSVAVDIYFSRESGTTVFGSGSAESLGRSLMFWRAGD